jgi:hypothetical protein
VSRIAAGLCFKARGRSAVDRTPLLASFCAEARGRRGVDRTAGLRSSTRAVVCLQVRLHAGSKCVAALPFVMSHAISAC